MPCYEQSRKVGVRDMSQNLNFHNTVCIGYKVTGCKNIVVITMEFQKITIKTCFSIVKISGKTISAIAIYRV